MTNLYDILYEKLMELKIKQNQLPLRDILEYVHFPLLNQYQVRDIGNRIANVLHKYNLKTKHDKVPLLLEDGSVQHVTLYHGQDYDIIFIVLKEWYDINIILTQTIENLSVITVDI